MTYNLDFSIAGLLFTIVLYVFLKLRFTNDEHTKLFRMEMLCLIVADSLDMITCWTIMNSQHVPNSVNYILMVLYYCSSPLVSYCACKYITALCGKYTRILDIIGDALLVFYEAIVITTPFTQFIFSFAPDHTYSHNEGFFLIYAMSGYFMLFAFIRFLHHKNQFSKTQIVSFFLYEILSIIGVMLQAISGEYMLGYFAASIGSFIVLFTLETPDFKKLQETMRELEKAEAEAEGANNLKSEFLATMSHELKTPLNGILGMTQVLKESSYLTKDDKKYLDNIDSEGKHILSIVNELLNLSKIEAGCLQLNNEDFRLSDMLGTLENEMTLLAEQKGLAFSMRTSDDLCNDLYGDESKIRQIITNLVSNAIKYTKEGEVLLTLWSVELGDNRVRLCISVKDTGIGLSENDKDIIFDKYTRVNENGEIKGTGLGLPITKELVEMMDGKIEVISEIDKGSVFCVEIECAKSEKSWLNVVDEAPCKTDGHAKKILVVDDTRMNIEVIKGLLKSENVEIVSAPNGPEAIEICYNEGFDVIFIDYKMPKMDGIETLHKLRELGIIKGTRTVILTASTTEELSKKFDEAGFNGKLYKPVEKDKLLREIYTDVSGSAENSMHQSLSDGDDCPKRYPFLDTREGLKNCCENSAMYEEMLKVFVENSRLGELENAYKNEEWKDYEVVSHGIKSSARIIGATELMKEMALMEEKASALNIEYIDSNHKRVRGLYQTLLEQIMNSLS